MTFILSLLFVSAAIATAARVEQAHVLGRPEGRPQQVVNGNTVQKQLNTYYFDVTKPHISFSASSSSARPQRTALTVTLAEGSVSKYMPVVTPKASGMVHGVSNTWKALRVSPSARCFGYVLLLPSSRPGGTWGTRFTRPAVVLTPFPPLWADAHHQGAKSV